MESAVSLSGLVKTFKEHRAVDGLSFDVPAGTIFGLLGRNGAGKTTTIRMIMDIIRPDSGRVRVLGQDMHDGLKDRIGYLPEERGLYPKMKIQEVLTFQGAIQGLTRIFKKKCHEVRARCGGHSQTKTTKNQTKLGRDGRVLEQFLKLGLVFRLRDVPVVLERGIDDQLIDQCISHSRYLSQRS